MRTTQRSKSHRYASLALAAATVVSAAVARADDGAAPAAPTTAPTMARQLRFEMANKAAAAAEVDAAVAAMRAAGRDEALIGNFMGEAEVRTEKAAFLGVVTTAADATVASQLDLPSGVGLAVTHVDPKSPAAEAGVQQHDVLHKLDDQLLINVPQLAALVRTFKPGDEVTLTVLRKGKPHAIKAKLIERELPVLAASGLAPVQINGMTFPNMGQAVGGMYAPRPPEEDGNVIIRRYGDAADAEGGPLELSVDGKVNFNANPRVIRLSPGARSTIERREDGQSYRLEIVDGRRTLTIKDDADKTWFEGAYNTPEEQEKVPAEFREKAKALLENFKIESAPTTLPAEPKADGGERAEVTSRAT